MGIFNQFTADGLRAHALANGYREQYNEALWDWLTANGYTQPDLNGKIAAAVAAGFDFSTFAASWTPADLFASSEVGVWYDPSDLSTMYQDSAGTTAAVVGQPVGLVLDKSKGLVLGSELMTNADLSSSTGWTNSGGVFADGSVTFDINGEYISQSVLPLEVGRWFKFEIVISSGSNMIAYCGTYSSGDVRYAKGSIGTGTNIFYLQSAGSNTFVKLATTSTGLPVVVDSFSVKELPGYHATQATAASRPVLRQTVGGLYYLEFDGTDDFLVTSAIDFTATDKIDAFCGWTQEDSLTSVVFEVSATVSSNNGSIAVLTYNAGRYIDGIRGTATGSYVMDASTPPKTRVTSSLFDIAKTNLVDEIVSRANAVVVSIRSEIDVGPAGTGNFGNYPLYIGRRGGTTLPFNGSIYSIIVRGKLSDATEISNAEAYVNGKTGAY